LIFSILKDFISSAQDYTVAIMEYEAPTLNSLNRSQKRALILRDQLRYIDPGHLDTFLEGVLPNEPPAYKRINGTVYPALRMVTLKECATRFDLGNLYLVKDVVLEDGIYHGFLTLENGRIEIRTEEALPLDDVNLDTVPIHFFVGKNMSKLFEDKCRAIFARLSLINEVRQAAYNSVNQPAQQFEEGEVSTIYTMRVTARCIPASFRFAVDCSLNVDSALWRPR
jgi:hypothetical protein